MTDIIVQVPDGEFNAFIARPSTDEAPVVIVCQEIFGVNEDMKAFCAELAAQGFVAICPDLFWRQDPGLSLSHWTEEEWKKGLELYAAFDFDKGVDDMLRTILMARTIPGANGRVGVIGFCLGGLLTYLATAAGGGDAGVAYYPGGADQHLDRAGGIKGPLMIHLGVEDEFISKDAQAAIASALADDPCVTLYSYPGQSHAFARHTGTHYDAASAALAGGRTYAFLEKHLR